MSINSFIKAINTNNGNNDCITSFLNNLIDDKYGFFVIAEQKSLRSIFFKNKYSLEEGDPRFDLIKKMSRDIKGDGCAKLLLCMAKVDPSKAMTELSSNSIFSLIIKFLKTIENNQTNYYWLKKALFNSAHDFVNTGFEFPLNFPIKNNLSDIQIALIFDSLYKKERIEYVKNLFNLIPDKKLQILIICRLISACNPKLGLTLYIDNDQIKNCLTPEYKREIFARAIDKDPELLQKVRSLIEDESELEKIYMLLEAKGNSSNLRNWDRFNSR